MQAGSLKQNSHQLLVKPLNGTVIILGGIDKRVSGTLIITVIQVDIYLLVDRSLVCG